MWVNPIVGSSLYFWEKQNDMISVISVTDKYILQPSLVTQHKTTREWISATLLWKRELNFLQKMLDRYAVALPNQDDKNTADHFQRIIMLYRDELIDKVRTKLRLHEKKLATMLETRDELNTSYFKEHDDLMDEVASMSSQLARYKEEFFFFVEKLM